MQVAEAPSRLNVLACKFGRISKNGNLSDDKLERTNEVAQRLKQIGKQYALEALKKLS